MTETQHRVWRYGDNVNTDVIFPGKYTYTLRETSELRSHALEDIDPQFAQRAQPGDVIVAGRNWGNGSSREQAVTALVALGIHAVIAVSFARIYYRNAINSGLLVIECPEAVPHIHTGDTIALDAAACTLTCRGGTFSYPTFPPSVRAIVEAGGLIPYLQGRKG